MRTLVVCLVLSLAPSALGQNQKHFKRAETLRAVESFYVAVDELSPDLTLIGISESSIRTAVELRLRSLGLPVSTNQHAGNKFLMVATSGICNDYKATCAMSMRLDFVRQVIVIVGDDIGTTNGTTFHIAKISIGGIDTFRRDWKQSLLDLVDEFANDFLAQNPRK